MTHLKNIARWS